MEQLKIMEDESQREDISLWGSALGGAQTPSSTQDLSNSTAYREIIAILHQTPLLVGPTNKWLKIKMAEMARAQLNILYTPEELAEMMKSIQ